MATTKKKKAAVKVVSSKKKSLSTHGLILAALLAILVVAVAGFGLTSLIQKKQAGAVGAETCGSGYVLYSSAAMKSSGGKIGPAVLRAYHNKAGTTCGLLIATGAAYGVSKPMKLVMRDSNGTAVATDSDNFRYYAGPLRGATCKAYSASMTYNGVTYTGKTNCIYPFE